MGVTGGDGSDVGAVGRYDDSFGGGDGGSGDLLAGGVGSGTGVWGRGFVGGDGAFFLYCLLRVRLVDLLDGLASLGFDWGGLSTSAYTTPSNPSTSKQEKRLETEIENCL